MSGSAARAGIDASADRVPAKKNSIEKMGTSAFAENKAEAVEEAGSQDSFEDGVFFAK